MPEFSSFEAGFLDVNKIAINGANVVRVELLPPVGMGQPERLEVFFVNSTFAVVYDVPLTSDGKQFMDLFVSNLTRGIRDDPRQIRRRQK